jgi:hypothetical protein
MSAVQPQKARYDTHNKETRAARLGEATINDRGKADRRTAPNVAMFWKVGRLSV